MNQQHPHIKFEIEKPVIKPESKTLSLLDFTVTITNKGSSEFEFYKKKAKKPVFVHHNSALPKHAKLNMIKNERKQIHQRCSTQQTKRKHNEEFNNVLYAPMDIHSMWLTSLNHPFQLNQHYPHNMDKTEWLYFHTPYISDAIDYKLKRMFHKEGLNVRITHRSSTLRQALKPGCSKPDSPITEKG